MESTIIKCPHCNAEYHVAEIFMPEEIEGRPINIIKDPLGKIIYSEWEENPMQMAKYTCDYCNKDFTVKAEVICKASTICEELDFKQEYVSLLD